MQFKVGDRVEVVEPAECVEDPNNRLGTGTILEADDREYFYVKVDSNTKPWWYAERCLRALPTPTPSITVGTQVRLTGVVTAQDSNEVLAIRLDTDGTIIYVEPLHRSRLEVIRQPFKRGEVVYFEDHNIACVVLEDEQNGRMLLIEAGEGKYATYVDADQYERRP